MTILSVFLLLQDTVNAVVPVVPVIATTDNTGRRDIILAIIAAMVTIITTVGPVLINRWMDKLKEERVLAAATVAAAAEIVAQKVEEVKAAAKGTKVGIEHLQETADATHLIVNSRYSEIREELKRSNENNQRMSEILGRMGILPMKPPASEVIAEPDGDRRVGDPDRRTQEQKDADDAAAIKAAGGEPTGGEGA